MLPPGDLPKPGIKPMSLLSPGLAGGFFTASNIWEAQKGYADAQKLMKVCSISVVSR